MAKKQQPPPVQLELLAILPKEWAATINEANKEGAKALLRGEVGKCLDYWNLALHLARKGGNNEHKND